MKTRILSILLLLALPVLGQAPPIPGGIVPPVPEEPAPPSPFAAAAKPLMPDPDALATPRGQRFEHPNIDGQTAAFLYYELTGKRVLVSSAAAQAEISIIQPGPLTNRQAATLLEKQLHMEGFALIPSGDNEVKMVLSQGTATPPTEGPPVLGSVDDLPEGDEFVTYVMPLEYLKPEEAMRAFQQVVGTFGPSGKVASVPNASSVVISANTPLLRMLIELKNRIDVPSAKVATSFVDVVYADVEELSERLNEIFNDQQQGSQSARVQRTQPAPVPGLQTALGGGGNAGEDTPVNILPDIRTNRIFLMGRPVDLAFIEGLIKDFDQPSSKRNFLRRKLRYLPVAEFLPVAENALERTGTGTATGGGGGSRSGRTGTSASSRTSSTRTGSSSSRSSSTSGGTSGGSGQGGGGSRAQLSEQAVETAPESILVGKTLLVADNISNSIVVQGAPHHVEIIENLIAELDVPSEQIAITAVFGRFAMTDNTSFGVELANVFEEISGDVGLGGRLSTGGVPSVINPLDLADMNTLLSEGTGAGLSLYGLFTDDFSFFVNAVERKTNLTTFSRPTVFTTNNHEARVSAGKRIAVPTSTFTGVGSSGQSTNIEYRDIVTELVVIPLVNDQNEVTLNISLVRDTTGTERTIGTLETTDINTDEVSTVVTVPNRSTVILGGIVEEQESDNQNGIPILSSIPVLGRIFGDSDLKDERSELVIMIHPSIIYSHEGLEAYQREFDLKNDVGPRARASIATPGMLPGRGDYAGQDSGQKNGSSYSQKPNGQELPEQQPAKARAVATSPAQRAIQNKMRNRRRR